MIYNNIKKIFLTPENNYTNKSDLLVGKPRLYFIVAVLPPLFGVTIRKIWRFRWERLILWWGPTLSSKSIPIEIVFVLITLVSMRPVSVAVSVVIGLCSGLGLGNYEASWGSYCCSTSMIKSNTKVNYGLVWRIFWLAAYNIEFKKLRPKFMKYI